MRWFMFDFFIYGGRKLVSCKYKKNLTNISSFFCASSKKKRKGLCTLYSLVKKK